MTSLTRKFDGKIYRGYGPYYCPSGLRWNDLKEEVKSLKEQGGLVRVIKTKLNAGDARRGSGNTHIVWIYTRRK